MKFSFPLLTAALFVPFSKASEAQSLTEKWNIQNVIASNDGADPNEFTFSYPDTSKSWLTDKSGVNIDKVQITMYDFDCKPTTESNGGSNTATYGEVGINTGYGTDNTLTYNDATDPFDMLSLGYSTADGTGNDLLDFGFKMVPKNMAKIPEITTSTTLSVTDVDTTSSMKFCVRVGLYALEEDEYKIKQGGACPAGYEIITEEDKCREASQKLNFDPIPSGFGLTFVVPDDNKDSFVQGCSTEKTWVRFNPPSLSATDEKYGSRICIRKGYKNEINYQETQVTLSVTMSGGFNITEFAVAPKDKTSSTVEQTYKVVAKLCAEGQQEQISNGKSFNQGAAINVCITPESKADEDGVIITSVDSFSWTRTYPGTAIADTTQVAIKSKNTGSDDGLSDIIVTNPKEFIVTSVLFAKFYETDGTVTAAGAATMGFPTLRRLRNSDNKRNLQDDGTTVAPFDMTTTLSKADDGPAALQQTAGGTGTSITVVATIVGLATAILLA